MSKNKRMKKILIVQHEYFIIKLLINLVKKKRYYCWLGSVLMIKSESKTLRVFFLLTTTFCESLELKIKYQNL